MFLNFNMHSSHLEVLVKHRFWCSILRVGPEIWPSRLPSDVTAPGLGTAFWEQSRKSAETSALTSSQRHPGGYLEDNQASGKRFQVLRPQESRKGEATSVPGGKVLWQKWHFLNLVMHLKKHGCSILQEIKTGAADAAMKIKENLSNTCSWLSNQRVGRGWSSCKGHVVVQSLSH